MSDLPLWEPQHAQRAKERAIYLSEIAHGDFWKLCALRAIVAAARNLQRFTTDNVWFRLGDNIPDPQNRRVMGALMKKAQAAGLIVPTDEWRLTSHVQSHRRPKRVWRGGPNLYTVKDHR